VDRIRSLRLSSVRLPLAQAISDAKVLTGRQRPMTEVMMLFAEVDTDEGHHGLGISYSKRAGGPGQFAHAREVAPELIGEDPSDTGRLWTKLVWAGASVGRSGLATQAIAALDVALWDIKARRAGLPLAKLLGAYDEGVRCYNTSGGFLHTPIEEVLDNASASLAQGIAGVKIKVGQPDWREDVRRVESVRAHLGDDVPLMIDVNQQWDRPTAMRMGRIFDELDLEWIEEPLDAYDVEGHAQLTRTLSSPIASGEMLTSVREHLDLVEGRAVDVLQPDAARVGGITEFQRLATVAAQRQLQLAPHFAMELHLHLAAAYPLATWVEHFDWLEPLFEERVQLKDGRMLVPERPGLGLTLSEQARRWTVDQVTIDKPPY
jgi:L-alanine-DL-glutamate epimerase-like enolase superfamily enzyme